MPITTTKPQTSLWQGFGRMARILSAFAIALLAILMTTASMRGAETRPGVRSVVSDWSHRQVLFSAPHAASAHFRQLTLDRRYQMQDAARLAAAHAPALSKSNKPRDWSFDLGPGASVGDGMYPAKFSFDIDTASCSGDFVVFNTGAGAGANLVAYTNLYAGCAGSVPSVMWAYTTGAGGTMTSPVLSLDGSKVAFVQSEPSGAVLRIMQWRSGEGSFSDSARAWTGAVPDNTGLTSWAECAANQSCMISVPLAGAALDTNSPPFYDYVADALYVGDNNGSLHKFTGVFNGAPSEVLSGWPISLNSGAILTGPSYDAVSGNIFVGDSTGKLWYVRDITSTVGACASGAPPCVGTPNLDAGNGSGRPIIDGPMIDPTTQRVFVFIGCALGGSGHYGSATGEVIQTDTALGSVVRANLGIASNVDNLHDGIFDNSYFAGDYNNGHLYAGGNPDSWQGRILYSVGFDSSGTMSSGATAGPMLTRAAASQCSPLSEADNNGVDRIFLSVPSSGVAATLSGGNRCVGACVYSYNVTSCSLSSATEASSDISAAGGSSGIISIISQRSLRHFWRPRRMRGAGVTGGPQLSIAARSTASKSPRQMCAANLNCGKGVVRLVNGRTYHACIAIAAAIGIYA